jgi:hypothetical protein
MSSEGFLCEEASDTLENFQQLPLFNLLAFITTVDVPRSIPEQRHSV